MSSFTLGLVIAASVAGLVGTPAPDGDPVAVWPVSPAAVVTQFEPSEPYGPGHRGVDLAASPGQPVHAALDGRVAFAGPVAGRPVVVVQHGGGLRTTYLPVAAVLEVGDHVRRGDVVGRLSPSRHCSLRDCLHWGARRGSRYVDPISLVSRHVVLLPLRPMATHSAPTLGITLADPPRDQQLGRRPQGFNPLRSRIAFRSGSVKNFL